MKLPGLSLWLGVVLAAMLTACGGGGGSGSSTSISVSRSSASFTTARGGNQPAPVDVVMHFEGDGYLVGYPPDIEIPSWLNISQITPGESSPQTFRLSIQDTSSLPPGTYTTTVRFLTGRATSDGSDVKDIKSADLEVTYTVSPGITVDPASVSLNVMQGQSPAPTVMAVSKPDALWNVRTDASWVTATAHPNAAGGTLDLAYDLDGLLPGYYSAYIELYGTDQYEPRAGVTVSLQINQVQLLTSVSDLYFQAVSTADSLPVGQNVTVQAQGGGVIAFGMEAEYGASASDWLELASGTTPQSVSIRPKSTQLAAGDYQATVRLTSGGRATNAYFAVHYTVTGAELVVSGGPSDFKIDQQTTAADLSAAEVAVVGDNGAPQQWAVVYAPSWLEVLDQTGDTRTNRQLRYRVDVAKLADQENGDYPDYIQIQSNARNDRLWGVTTNLSIALPDIKAVMPAVAVAGQSLPHALGGSGFGDTTALKVNIGGKPLALSSAEAGKVARFTAPSTLAPGVYSISATNALGLARASTQLKVVAAASNERQMVPVSNLQTFDHVVYDALADRLIFDVVVEDSPYSGHYELWQLSKAAGGWAASKLLRFEDLRDYDLSADGAALWLLGDNTLYSLDLRDAESNPVAVVDIPKGPYQELGTHIRSLVDGRILLSSFQSYIYTPTLRIIDPSAKTISEPVPDEVMRGSSSCEHLPVLSSDGTRAALVRGACSSSSSEMVALFDTAAAHQTPTEFSGGDYITAAHSMDRIGRRLVLDSRVYAAATGSLTMLAQLQNTWATAFSPDGIRLYTHVPSVDGVAPGRLVVYDISGNPSRNEYPVLSTQELPELAHTPHPSLTVSADGSTLFIGGSNGVLVMSVP